mmetsp:Transcript_1799/g.5440  ORF Transcript_1799/g.5440 Transcript_1799/m.5440 type:complete len:331 (-) Transcript_1799:232-1224(-)
MPTTTVLVTGATGKQGGATVDALLAKGGFEIYALSRKANSPALEEKGVKMLTGDLNDQASLEAALRTSKATQVFLVTDFWIACKCMEDTEVLHGTNMINAVKAVDPAIFLVYTSVGDADKTGPAVRHFVAKARVEKHLAATLKAWAVLRPCSFLDNLDDPANFNPLTKGKVKFLLPADVPMKFVATTDIGKAAANVLATPANHEGKVLELATCMHTGSELANALTAASGTPCVYGVSLPRFVVKLMVPDLHAMMDYWEGREGGYTADVSAGRALVGPDAMDATAWFAHKGKWRSGQKFGEADPPSSSLRTAGAALLVAGVAVLLAARHSR